jgi:integrase
MKLSELTALILEGTSSLYRRRTRDAYRSTCRSIFSLTKEDCEVGELFNPAWVDSYQSFLQDRGLKRNTISFYMRILRSIYHKAVGMGLHEEVPGLFVKVFTGTEATVKRAVEPNVIRYIARATLSGNLAFARDMFMLCFYMQGMSYVDMAYLKKSDMQQGYIVYNRRKTGTQITVKVTPDALRIIKRYAHLTEKTPYLAPVILDPQKDDYVQYQSGLRMQNRNLKKLAGELQLKETLTTYVARHSWATMAYHSNVPVANISEAMGHRTEEVTRIYLRSLDRRVLSKANEAVIEALKGKHGRKRGRKKVSVYW